MMKTLFVLLSLTGYSVIALSQATPDTAFVQASVLSAKKIYDQSIERQLNIYNGRDYKLYVPIGEEHPYFLTDDWTLSTIVYESDLYTSIPVLFDLSSEKVLTENPFNGEVMELASSKIERFEIHGHTFVRLNRNPTFESEMTDGFYELLYQGNLKLYAKRKKNFQERPKANIMYAEFDEKNKYFLFNGRQYYRVTGKSSFIKAMGGKKKIPGGSVRKSKTYAVNKTEDTLIYLTELYDTHTPAL